MMDNDRFISASAGTGKTHTISKAYVDLFEQAFLNGRVYRCRQCSSHNIYQKGCRRDEIPNSGYDQVQGERQSSLAAAQILHGLCLDKHH